MVAVGDAVAAGDPLLFIEPGEVASDPVYEGIVTRDTNSLTAENVMKWSVIHPQLDTWNYAGADAVAERAIRADGARTHGHHARSHRDSLTQPDHRTHTPSRALPHLRSQVRKAESWWASIRDWVACSKPWNVGRYTAMLGASAPTRAAHGSQGSARPLEARPAAAARR